MKLNERGSYLLAFGLIAFTLVTSTVVLAGINSGNPYFKWQPPTITPDGQPVPETGSTAITFFQLFCNNNAVPVVTLPSNRRDWTAPVGIFKKDVLYVCTLKTKFKNGGATQTMAVSFKIPATPP